MPSGKQQVFANRLGWAKTYLEKAGLLRSVRRGVYQLSEAGKQVLASKPEVITNDTLAQYPSFRTFIDGDEEGVSRILPLSLPFNPRRRPMSSWRPRTVSFGDRLSAKSST